MSDNAEIADRRKVQYASDGWGPLIQRNYWAAIAGADCTPEGLIRMVRERFADFAPCETAEFRRTDGGSGPLEAGSEFEIDISLVGKCHVRIVHIDDRSLTLRTLNGHPESGRITFGATRDEQGQLVFRICSRTRSSSLVNHMGFLVMGKQMQGRTWIKFIDKLAAECGGHIPEAIHVEGPHEVEQERADREPVEEPTFRCCEGAS